MTDRPIIFSGQMVRALLDGRKTMTRRLAWRRVADLTAVKLGKSPGYDTSESKGSGVFRPTAWQRVQPGDRLWVREACGTGGYFPPGWSYRADGVEYPHERWTPSIHMPRRASRLTLTVTGVKIERLQDISESDIEAEGVTLPPSTLFPRTNRGFKLKQQFEKLWSGLHGAGAWTANPEVVALTFTVAKQNIDKVPA